MNKPFGLVDHMWVAQSHTDTPVNDDEPEVIRETAIFG